jgi:hypothetical protein
MDGDPILRPVWTWSANPFPKAEKRTFSGTVSSLVKKGCVEIDGHGEEATICITAEGMAAFRIGGE